MITQQDIRAWCDELQACVRAIDYGRAEKIFAPDVVGFGTYKDIAQGRETLRAEQWSNIWPKVRDFTFRLEQLYWGAAGELPPARGTPPASPPTAHPATAPAG